MRDFSNKCIRRWLRISATSCEHQRAASKAERKHGANTRFGSRASVTEKFRPGVLPPEGTKVPLCDSAEGTKPSICANFSAGAAHTAGLPRATSQRNQGEPPAPEAESTSGRELRVPAKPERIMGVKEVSERRRGAAYCPAFGPSGLGAAPRPKQGARWRASAPRSVGRELRAPALSEHKKEAARRRGPPGQKEGGCDSRKSRVLLFRDKAGK